MADGLLRVESGRASTRCDSSSEQVSYYDDMSVLSGPTRLTQEQLLAWRLFLRAHASVSRRLEQDLLAEHQLPLAWYDVLVQLSESPDQRVRMTDLAERVLLSRSGLTRLIDRMATAGLVERQSCPSDARGTFTALTPDGFARLRSAASVHLRGIHEYMVDQFTNEELATLATLLGRLASHRTSTLEDADPCPGR